jgi:RHS repeat-associated protein
VTDAAGNTATVTTTVNIDLAGPAISATETPAPDSYGWNNTAVTVSFICTPSAAPIVSCSSSQTVSTAGANQPVTGTAVDAAGLTASTTALVSIDLTPPTITITSPANGATLTTSPVSVSGNVSAALAGIASVSCNGVAATVQSGSYSCSVPLSAGTDTISVLATDMAGNTATQSINTTLIVPATISSFSPSSTSIGSLVTVQGSGFSQTGFPPEVTLTQEGGGTIVAPISSTTANTLSFVVPSGAATGPITVTVDGLTAASSSLLTIVGSSSFSLTAGPSSVTLLPGQTATVQVSLASGNGFTQLAALSLAGLPSGVTATFQPPQITAGGTSLLSLSAPASQTASTSSLTIAATATVQGIPETQTAAVLLNIQIPSGSVTFTGQIAVTGVYNTPLVGVSVSFTGKNYTGAQTGCTGSATTDAGGNFILNGSSSCAGSQMIQYDPSTVTSPPGKYSGVTLSYVLTAGQVTTPGIVVHLPNVTNAETFSVSQNSTTNQTFVSQSIRGLSITVYAGTTFSLADGTQPSPFPLSVVEIPYSQIPDYMPPNPTEDPIFAMSIEPFNSSSNQPVAITFPNRKNTLPGTDMPLTSLNPTLGMMVNYGTGVVSADGTRIVPDPDPANPGHLYGISHFDWHFPLPGPGGGPFPGGGGGGGGSGGGGPGGGDPVDAATGILTLSKPDIAIGGARGQIAVVRSYQEMTSGPGPFGIGTNHNYNWRVDMTNLSSVQGAASVIGLVRPDGNEFAFSGTAGGTFTNTSVPTVEGSTITTSQCFTNDYGYGCSATLTWRNGTVYKFSPLVTGEPFAGFLTSITDPNGNTITILHDNSSNPTLVDSIIDPVGRSLTFSYNGSVITSITDPIGRSVQYTYNSIGKLATVVDLGGGTTTYTYNGQGQLASITDARNITYLQNFYDSNGRVIQQTAADGGNTYFSYTQLNPAVPSSPISSTTITDPLGNTTTYNFNAMSVPISVTDAKGQTTVYNIDPNTNLTDSVVDPLQRTTAFTYDPYGNTTSITRLFGTSNAVTTNYTYGAFNRLTSVTDAMGHTTSYTYDNKGNLFTKADPLGHQINYAYDSYGEPASVTDPLGNTVVFSYVNGALATITDPLGNVTTRVTDAVARLTSITNPLGQTTSYQYNNQNNITSVTNAIDGVTSFSYDPNGNLLTVQDARQQGTNNMTVYAYDSMDRLMTRTDPLGRQESYTHDQDGNITSVADRRGVVTKFQYDTLNRRYFMGFGANGSSYQSTVTYNYDAGSRVYSVVDSSSGTVTSQLDGRDNLLSETGPLGSISYGYDPAGRRTSSVMSGQPAVNYVYDNTNRLTLIKQGSSTTAFSYDNSNRRIAMTLPNSIVANYGYDADSHVTSISYQIGSTSIGNLSYTYDAGGRRTQVGGTLAGSGFPSAVASATYDTANELINWNGTSISYDANGSILNDGTANYTWNERNQLVGRGSVTYQYDAFGRRIRNASGHGLLYDGDQPTQEQSAGIPITNWLAGSIDEIFSISGSNGVSIPLTDALGSVLALANSAGTVVTQYTYDPFGNAQTFGVASSNTFQFQGRENDGTGLYYYRARYYSPSLHRFVSQDPLGYVAGANTYTYGFNNPVSVGDPSGKSPCVVGALAGVILYNSYTIYQEINSAVHGRKGPNPGGWSGAWQILTGSASAAVTGCAVADGAAGFWDALGSGAQGAAEGVAQAAGQLPQEVADTYENGQYTARVLDEDTIYYRAETDSMPDGPGRWFGTEAPGTEAEADQMYNISGPNPANEMNVVNSYNVPAGTTVYEGPVAGGTGTQIYIPNPVGSGVTQIGSTPLPDYIPR